MKRIITGIVLVAVFVSLVLYGPPYFIFAAQMVIAMAGVWEFFRLAEAAHVRTFQLPGYLFALSVSALPAYSMVGKLVLPILQIDIALWVVAVSALFLEIFMVVGMRPAIGLTGYLSSVSGTFFGPIYVAIPIALLVSVWLGSNGPHRVLFALVVVWAGDTAAYFVGKNFGKHKSSPRISPNKTWEGTIASFIAAVLVGAVTARYGWLGAGYAELLVLAAALNIAAQLGDLAESALKRSTGVKDSSNLIPGHGGVLDRIDALLFAAPVLWYYWASHPGFIR